ncbi:hypothetical protein [Streptomyces sp. NPDC026673]|uniref:hypothetical protein n=1 Tax=Streptomyces sp. NPDC026673 TaxID=3155724 RepID=UPI0033ECA3FA
MTPHDAPQTSASTPPPGQGADRQHADGAVPEPPTARLARTDRRTAPRQSLCANPDWPVDGPRWAPEVPGGLAA